jgi:hypothetical protein
VPTAELRGSEADLGEPSYLQSGKGAKGPYVPIEAYDMFESGLQARKILLGLFDKGQKVARLGD